MAERTVHIGEAVGPIPASRTKYAIMTHASTAEKSIEPWHLRADEVLARLQSDIKNGLSDEEAKSRMLRYGPNQLASAAPDSAFKLFLNQFKNSLIVILLLATLFSGALGHVVEAIAIIVIILFAVILGFIQEFRAGKALQALRTLAAPTALVVRNGIDIKIPASQVVPGDIIIISTGDRFPADARLVESVNLKAEEAILTGESLPSEKTAAEVFDEQAPLGDRRNMVFAGTTATYGRGRAVVTSTGMKTEFGKVAGMLKEVTKEETPLEKNLDNIARILSRVAFLVVMGIVALGLFRGQPILEMIVFGIALAVAVVPEALPAVVTISLAIGVQRMVRRNALILRLPAVETLGCTTIICTDKTGTLTKDEMTVRKILLADGAIVDVTGSGYEPAGEFLTSGAQYVPDDSMKFLLKAAALCSDAKLEKNGGWSIAGDPTEGALVVAAEKAGLKKIFLDESFPRIAEIPFSAEEKRMTTLHKSAEGDIAYSKGAPEVILDSCTHYHTAQGIKNLTKEEKEKILRSSNEFAAQALRVLAVSYVKSKELQLHPKEMVFLGMFGMIDPPRPEAKEALLLCKQAGIKVMMITGDHPATARAIAEELEILSLEGQVITGQELAALSDSALLERIEKISVCARVSPEHKLRIVQALQKKGHVVAMTGDGVNDAPAIKKADIGIAMGIKGTDVSRQAADMTLTDDNFASIVAAVEEGRIIFGNIKKYLMYLLSSNIGEIGLIVATSLLGLPIPLSAVQILYVNLATDGLPALALAVDPPESDVMRRSPRKMRAGIFSKRVVTLMIVGGVWSAIVNVFLFIFALRDGKGIALSMTMVFASLVLIQFFKAYNFRSDHISILHRPFENRWLNYAVLWELLLLMFILYVPFLQTPFKTVALSYNEWVIVALASVTVIPVLEIAKWLLRKYGNHKQ